MSTKMWIQSVERVAASSRAAFLSTQAVWIAKPAAKTLAAGPDVTNSETIS